MPDGIIRALPSGASTYAGHGRCSSLASAGLAQRGRGLGLWATRLALRCPAVAHVRAWHRPNDYRARWRPQAVASGYRENRQTSSHAYATLLSPAGIGPRLHRRASASARDAAPTQSPASLARTIAA